MALELMRPLRRSWRLATQDPEANRGLISTIAAYIVSRQNANGSWDYVGRGAGDTSISQYAVLGLWEAENDAVEIPPSVWDRAAAWYMSSQSSAGSWNYHRDEAMHPETCAMTAAGIGSLLICQRQLERFRSKNRELSPLLIPLVADTEHGDYRPSTSVSGINNAVSRGIVMAIGEFRAE